MDRLGSLTATALLGIDTLWGGDVMNPSGTGRAIVDSWFSDEPHARGVHAPDGGDDCGRPAASRPRSPTAPRSTRTSRPST